jgi:hypothetical protein
VIWLEVNKRRETGNQIEAKNTSCSDDICTLREKAREREREMKTKFTIGSPRKSIEWQNGRWVNWSADLHRRRVTEEASKKTKGVVDQKKRQTVCPNDLGIQIKSRLWLLKNVIKADLSSDRDEDDEEEKDDKQDERDDEEKWANKKCNNCA